MKYWLIVYARRRGELLRCEEFSDGREALTQRFDWERYYSGTPDIEVVTLGADSLDTLKITHSRYFAAPALRDAQGGQS